MYDDEDDIEQKVNASEDCPNCGYPLIGQYLGVYKAGVPCDKCGYTDQEAAREGAKIAKDREERVNRNRENPPQFKSVEDWESWSATHK